MRKSLGVGLLFAAATILWAQHDHAEAKSYVGSLAKAPGNAMIGLVIEGDNFLAYVCANDAAFNESHARWFRGKLEGGAMAAESAGGRLAAKLAADKIEGTVTGADGKAFAFTATLAQSGGVFRAEMYDDKDHYICGWVRNDEGLIVGNGTKQGKPAGFKNQAPAEKKGAPEGLVGLNQKKLTGSLVDELGPILPGQVVRGTLASIDAKKNTFTVKTLDGKSLTLPGNKLFGLDEKGKATPINLKDPASSPTPFLFGGRLEISAKCTTTETTSKKGGTTTKTKTRDCSLTVNGRVIF